MAIYAGRYYAAPIWFLPIMEPFYPRQLPGLSLVLDLAKLAGSIYLGSRSSLCRTLIMDSFLADLPLGNYFTHRTAIGSWITLDDTLGDYCSVLEGCSK